MKLFTTLVLVILILVVAGFLGWTRVPDMLAHKMSKHMRVQVEIDDITLSSQKITIDKLTIGNPPGSILSKALSADVIEINAPFSRYLKDHIIIEEIDIDYIYLGLEFDAPNSTNGNWTTIMAKMKGPDSGTSTSNPHAVLIKKLVLTNIQPELVYRKGGGKPQKLPLIKRLEFTNVTSTEGIPSDQIANAVLKETLRSIFQKENLQNMLEGIIQQPDSAVDQLLQPFKGFFGQ